MNESVLELKIKKAAKDRGILSFKFVSPGQKGVPDRLFITKGGYQFYMELKSANGKLSDLQDAVIKTMISYGADVSVVRNLEDGIKILEERKDLHGSKLIIN